MKTRKTPLPPDLPGALAQADALTTEMRQALRDLDDIEGVRFVGVSFDDVITWRASFRGCVFERCVFDPAAEVNAFDFLDCAFLGTDFAGMQLAKAAFQRVRFASCRAVGAYFTEAAFRNATFDDCQLAYANFGLSRLSDVSFSACDANHASFGYATFSNVQFSRIKLSGAEFFGAKLKGIDLRTCQIDGIVLADRTELAGATITPLQALDLIHLLGVTVAEAE